MSWFRHVPVDVIAQLNMPVLITHGTHDIQVNVAEAEALHVAKPAARLVMVEEMNHVLKRAPLDPEEQAASYSDPSLPVMPELGRRGCRVGPRWRR